MADTEEHISHDKTVTGILKKDVGAPDRKSYRVVTELFKRGKTYTKGEIIELDEDTAERFKERGDIE